MTSRIKRRILRVSRTDMCRIEIGHSLVEKCGELISATVGSGPVTLVADSKVLSLHGQRLLDSFDSVGIHASVITVRPGERTKTLDQAKKLWLQLLAHRSTRKSPIVAFGGGTVSDLAGFVASTFMKGVPFVIVPTTLVGQVDASVGGKAAINLPQGKNLIGTFVQPALVAVDPDLLSTLSGREMRNGFAEIMKVAAIGSEPLFSLIENNYQAVLSRETALLARTIAAAIDVKLRFITSNPWERNLRRELNFGHTLGHAVESTFRYSHYSHGEAISIGMAAACRLGLARRITDRESYDRMIRLLKLSGLPMTVSAVDARPLTEALAVIRLVRGGNWHFVVLRRIGEASFLEDVDEEELVSAGVGGLNAKEGARTRGGRQRS